MKICMLIINPHAGKAQAKAALFEAVDILFQGGYEATIFPTQKPKDATAFVQNRAKEYDLVVCCGGDGTFNETVTGLMALENPPPVGYLPAGTTNDLASSLRIPRNLSQAAEGIIEGASFGYDIGRFNDRYFSYIAAFGIFTEVSYATPQTLKNMLGHLAYLLQSMKTLGEVKSRRLRIESDGKVVEGEFLFGAVTNSTSVAGLFTLNPDEVQPDDGLFEALFIRKPQNAIQTQQTINSLLSWNYEGSNIEFFHTSCLTVTSDEEIGWTLDGENGGKHRTVRIENCPQAVRILRPEEIETVL